MKGLQKFGTKKGVENMKPTKKALLKEIDAKNRECLELQRRINELEDRVDWLERVNEKLIEELADYVSFYEKVSALVGDGTAPEVELDVELGTVTYDKLGDCEVKLADAVTTAKFADSGVTTVIFIGE